MPESKGGLGEIRTPVEYLIIGISSEDGLLMLNLEHPRLGRKAVPANAEEIKPLMKCVNSREVGSLIGKHFIDNEIGCPLFQMIRETPFSPQHTEL